MTKTEWKAAEGLAWGMYVCGDRDAYNKLLQSGKLISSSREAFQRVRKFYCALYVCMSNSSFCSGTKLCI